MRLAVCFRLTAGLRAVWHVPRGLWHNLTLRLGHWYPIVTVYLSHLPEPERMDSMSKTPETHCLCRARGAMGLTLVALAAWALAASTVAMSTDYLQSKVDTRLSKNLKSKVGMMLTDGFKAPSDQKMFEEFYKKCVFPEWTDPNNFARKLPKAKTVTTPRQRILRDLLRAQHKPVYDKLNELAFDQMLEFAKGNYHPATRYNAMLLVGELNVEKPAFDKPPRPLPKAFPELMSAAQDESLPDAVRLPALLGIIRHSKFGAADDQSRQKISGLMLSLAAMQQPPKGRSTEGHAWFRCLAIETLGRFASPGKDGAVAKAIASVIAETDAPLWLRCEAAAALGRLKLTPESGLDPAEVGKSLDGLFIDVAKEEIRLGEEEKDYLIDARQLKARLLDILAALKGIRALAARPAAGAAAAALPAEVEARQKDIENLLSREYLDHDDLAAKADKKKPDESAAPPGFGPGGEGLGGPMGPERMGSPMGPEGMGPGGLMGPGVTDATAQYNPAKPILEKIMAELIRLVDEYEKRQAGA